jgi:hypothetical protein
MANKVLSTLGIIAMLGGTYWVLSLAVSQEPELLVPVGFGEPRGDHVEFNFAVSMMMPRRDPPKLHNGVVLWNEWVADHFTVQSDDGERLTLRRSDFSKAIPSQVAGTPEFFLIGTLESGVAYTLEYVPLLGEPERYRYEFVAPTEPRPAARVVFERQAQP